MLLERRVRLDAREADPNIKDDDTLWVKHVAANTNAGAGGGRGGFGGFGGGTSVQVSR